MAFPVAEPIEYDRWYALAPGEAAARLEVDPARGLSQQEAALRLSRYGPNALVEPPRRSRLLLFLDQFRSLFVYVLLGAAVLAAVVGDVKDPIVITAVLFVNAFIGFVQTHRAERSMEALKRMLALQVRVRREGRVIHLPSEQLVPGDVVILEAGDRIPADGRLLVAVNLAIDESALTGESVPVEKISDRLPDLQLPVSEHVNLAFMNAAVVGGRAELLVTSTGMATEVGRIAGMLVGIGVQSTPLQRQLDGVGRRIALLAAIASLAVLALALAQGDAWNDAILTAAALAVAAIPEGLPAVVAVTLAVGAHQMAQHNAIVKRLASVETLGCATAICTDKTGTLTLNQMTVRALVFAGRPIEVEGHGYQPSGRIIAGDGRPVPDLATLVLPGALCNNARVVDGEVVGDPTEAAFIVLASKAGVDVESLIDRHPRIAEVPFDSSYKFMATFHSAVGIAGGRKLIHVKGAPEVVLPRCRTVRTDGGPLSLGGDSLDGVHADVSALAARGLRVLAIATREVGDDVPVEHLGQLELLELVNGLELHLLVGILDPPRPEAREAIARCHEAGITVRMITGDHATTAHAIARDLAIPGGALDGPALERLTVEELAGRIEDVGVFARVAPEHKVLIVEALRARGHVVAMTGDGVNDAAALKIADIGVAMGITGTEVAKEAAEMVLADDNFATIVQAIERGRTIYDNVLKFVRFQLSTNIGAILTILGARLLGLPTPFTPIQVLWVNLIMDGPPAIALGLDSPAPGVMSRPPRDPVASALPRGRVARLGFAGLVMAVGTLAVFADARSRYGADQATTMAFTTFVFFQVFNAFNQRSERESIFGRHSLTNWRLWVAISFAVALQVGAVVLPPLASIFDTVPLSGAQWLVCVATASSILAAEEIRKVAGRWARRDAANQRRSPVVSKV